MRWRYLCSFVRELNRKRNSGICCQRIVRITGSFISICCLLRIVYQLVKLKLRLIPHFRKTVSDGIQKTIKCRNLSTWTCFGYRFIVGIQYEVVLLYFISEKGMFSYTQWICKSSLLNWQKKCFFHSWFQLIPGCTVSL